MTTPDPDGTSGAKSAATELIGYDSSTNVTHVVAADGGVTTATYSSLSRVSSLTDQVGRTTNYAYDTLGNRLTAVDPAGFTTTFAYNSIGLPTSITQPDPDGAGALTSPVSSFSYDSYGRLITLTNSDSSTQTFTYNSADQLLTKVDELGKTVTLAYDSLGRQTSETNRVSATTTYSYDALSRVIKQTDALGNVTDIEYNNRGWVKKIIYPDPDGAGSLSRPEDVRNFDTVGNVLSHGASTSYFSSSSVSTFDADNRKASESDPADVLKKVFYLYDNTGNVTTVYRVAGNIGDSTGKTVIDYDSVGRVTRQRVETNPMMGSPVIQQDQSTAYNLAGEVTSQTDGRGYVTSFTYNSRGLLATETLPDADGSGSQWGLLVSYNYDNTGRLTSVNRGFSRVTTLEYNNRSWLTKLTRPDPDGAGSLSAPIIQFGYNTRGDRTTVTDALGGVTTTAFDDQQRPTSVTYPDPDSAGPLSSPVESTAYDLLNRITSKTNALGGVTSFTYDALSRQLTQTDPDPDGAGPLSSAVTTLTYSASGLSQVTDALSRSVSYSRDGQGRITSTTDGSGNVTSFTYDYYSNVLSKTEPDPDGSGPLGRPVTTFSYDVANRQIQKVEPRSGSTIYAYDKANNLTSLTDPSSNTTNFGYDGMNRLILNTNALSKSQSYTYDVAGNMVRSADRNGKVIEYDFDTLDRSTAERWQSSTTTPTLAIATTQNGGAADEQQSVGWTSSGMGISGTYTLTQDGQTTSALAWNASAATVQSALESLSTIGSGNVLVTVSSPSSYSRTIQINFRNGKAGTNMAQTTIDVTNISIVFGSKTPFANTDIQGGAYSEIQTISLSNASSGQWRVAFDGEVSSPLSVGISAADLKTALDSFTGIDNVTVTGSSGSFTVTFGGSQAGVNVSQLFGDASSTSCGSTTQTITSSYNVNDDLTAISDSNATISYTLDALGRTTAISNSIAGLTPSVTLNQVFNSAGLRTELNATIGSTLDFKNSYQYDTLGRMTELIQQGQSGGNAVTGKRATIGYNALNQRTLVSRFQSTGSTNAVATTEYSYDTLNRLSGQTHKQGTTTLAGYTYGYDGMSRLTSVTSTIEGLSTYSYDAGSQVVGADHAAGGQPDEAYSFDANGNRNSSGYTTTSNNRTTAQPGFTYAYDDQGNRTSRTETATGKVTEYSWDHRNRLTTVKDRATSGGSVIKQVDYAYDAFNRLVKRTYDADGAGSGGATTQYWVYDEGINAVMQFDGSSSSNLSHRYLWTDAVDELMADEIVGTGADTQYALGDHLGTIRDIANFIESTSVTSVTNHRTYSSFGTLTAESNSAIDLIFGYTGKQLDDATGLQHNLFRWYDSALGQWLSEDPLRFVAGDENLKRYVGNRTQSQGDTLGLMPTQGGAINIKLVLEYIKTLEANNPTASPSQILAMWSHEACWGFANQFPMAETLGVVGAQPPKNQLPWVYVYTDENGWIDVQHFLVNAQLTIKNPILSPIVGAGATMYEYYTYLVGLSDPSRPGFGSSAFTGEDEISNRLGRDFAVNFDHSELLSAQISNFFQAMGAYSDPTKAWNYDLLPESEEQWEQAWHNYPEIAMLRCEIVLNYDHQYWSTHPLQSDYVQSNIADGRIWTPLSTPAGP